MLVFVFVFIVVLVLGGCGIFKGGKFKIVVLGECVFILISENDVIVELLIVDV